MVNDSVMFLFCGMNKNDLEYDAEVYKIVVAMAENLVPDVCALIMAALEDIHIEAGRLEWKKKIREVNALYSKCLYCYPSGRYAIFQQMSWSEFNWRGLNEYSVTSENFIWNKYGHNVAKLPPNY